MTAAEPDVVDVRPVSRWGLAWRVLGALALVALLVNGSARMDDDVWPFGPMSQYADSKPAVDTVVVTRVDALLADGRRVEIPLRVETAGISRAEVEARIPDFRRDPGLLRVVAEGWAARHPAEPAVRELVLSQDRTFLDRGRRTGGDRVPVVTWAVPGG